jgi:hypothetical protein
VQTPRVAPCNFSDESAIPQKHKGTLAGYYLNATRTAELDSFGTAPLDRPRDTSRPRECRPGRNLRPRPQSLPAKLSGAPRRSLAGCLAGAQSSVAPKASNALGLTGTMSYPLRQSSSIRKPAHFRGDGTLCEAVLFRRCHRRTRCRVRCSLRKASAPPHSRTVPARHQSENKPPRDENNATGSSVFCHSERSRGTCFLRSSNLALKALQPMFRVVARPSRNRLDVPATPPLA